eukprot:NODE_170_length_16226_cov_0.451169.p9 type:complete len:256 gc:universal NODE_170_length_16226_cov_0.451169:15111-15878(+)
MSSNLMDGTNIIEWHIDGWFKGSFCALAGLSLFLAIPGIFERSGSSILNVILVFFTSIAVSIRPTRMVYISKQCYTISLLYWSTNSVFMGLLFCYFGLRFENVQKVFYFIGSIVTVSSITSLLGYHNYCPNGMLMDEYFDVSTSYHGATLALSSCFSIYIMVKEFKGKLVIEEDKRLTRIHLLSVATLYISAVLALLTSVFSFTSFMNLRILCMFSSIYAVTISQLSMLLYKSLKQDTAVIGKTSPSPSNNRLNK